MEIGLRFLLVPLVSLVSISSQATESSFATLTEVNPRLAFTCKHEAIPTPTADADLLFKYARWLQKNNQLERNEAVDAEVERLYRIASESGHYKANINLQSGGMRGQFKVLSSEYLQMSQQLISAGVATGYYFVGIFLEQGAAGLEKNPDMSLRFLRKAADEGSALAQYVVGGKLEPQNASPLVALEMYKCSASQGNGDAATLLGLFLRDEGKYQEALEAFQQGVAAGASSAAHRLEKAFSDPKPSDTFDYLALHNDSERATRYEAVWRILANYSYANPTVPEINEIVPLPPAKLPEWDGKLQWLEDRLANIPPPKPSEALISQLALVKHLDPATGKPVFSGTDSAAHRVARPRLSTLIPDSSTTMSDSTRDLARSRP